ncbi:tRNA (5-methylaminomethyl-2-thiouridylate)-methyltransferase [Rhodothalassium salexigens DSM 2132]|uniref:tRNA-specific 2-thiouridylase MnmA n=3 Tax=Rhodothalassium salexigens TaxID=1086 RepID=A0A4R2PGE8_RHOSA|nr:tRNA 2-thiouridine(34) synthase MnmA [Rhodothalassium salexigens]TCP34430.1 tRNA (5-methylaminomethyl-2-thiouridylate)-methyltransferase [Rhodothalassium salexigens DSM 2132]
MTGIMMTADDLSDLFPAWTPGTPNALGFDRAPGDTRVVVAMSGGVDSSVTAGLLHALGFEVIGITLQLYDHGAAVQKKGACCAGQDIHDARRVAERLGIPHYVLDYESRFRQSVVDDFADSYIRGETPIPCVRCNQTVKFRDLLGTARDLGADCLATGHYVQCVPGPDGRQLLRGTDRNRDQAYFLFATTAQQLDFLRFPLGGLEKDRVRQLADAMGLPVADKPDSQDICFVPNGDYARVIEGLRPGAAEPGDIVHVDGRRLGSHQGIIHYTIGQRRGLGVGGEGEPVYVVRLEPDTRRVVVGPKEALLAAGLDAKEVNWLAEPPGPEGRAVTVKIRNTAEPVPARVVLTGTGATVTFDRPEAGVSPGQAVVFFDGERVLGGGWITRAESAYAMRAA